jgi:hypothetical protein
MKGNHKHGQSKKGSVTKIYMVWLAMRKRCTNSNDPSYPRYGGRGIGVDPRWDNFELFLEDMGMPPEGTSLDRIDNSGPYSPSNCRWVTESEQHRNTRRNLWVTVDGVTRIAQDWAAALGVSRQTIYNRVRRGQYVATKHA